MKDMKSLEEQIEFALFCYDFFNVSRFRQRIFDEVNRHLKVYYGEKGDLPANKNGYHELARLVRTETELGSIYDCILLRLFFWELAVLQNILSYCCWHPVKEPMNSYIEIVVELKRLVREDEIKIAADAKTIERFKEAVEAIELKANINFRYYFKLVDLVTFVCANSFPSYKARSEERRVGKECRSRWS